jgi:hypothetical protein
MLPLAKLLAIPGSIASAELKNCVALVGLVPPVGCQVKAVMAHAWLATFVIQAQ